MHEVAAAPVALALSAGIAAAAPMTLACTAWGGSHTSRYTFDVDPAACTVFWREIDTPLKVLLCAPPRLEAMKPFSPASGYVLKFNLATGGFSDHVPGWAERGRCESK